MGTGPAPVRVGVLVTGDVSVRAAHSLAAHPGVDEVVVVGPAKSKSFTVVDTARGCDLLIGSGPEAPAKARRHEVGLIWDGDTETEGVVVWGASPVGLALSLAARESDLQLVGAAHPDLAGAGGDQTTRFPDPVGRIAVADTTVGGRPVAIGKSPNDFAACLAVGAERRVTILDDGEFMSGIALAAGFAVAGKGGPVWDSALTYLETVTEMGLVMGERQ